MSLKDKVPPHNLDAEQATLGALLLDWDAVGIVLPYLRPERFYSIQNQKIFEAILSLYNKGTRGDLLTLQDELRSSGQLDAAGGIAYLSSLTDTVLRFPRVSGISFSDGRCIKTTPFSFSKLLSEIDFIRSWWNL